MKILWISTSSMQIQPLVTSLEYALPKILFTSVSSMNLAPIVSGLEAATKGKHEVVLFKFDKGKEEQFHHDSEVDLEIIKAVHEHKPDLIIYSGPAEGKCRPHTETFHIIKAHAKLMNLVCDGACPGWHPILEEYKRENAFDLICNIDGNANWPQRDSDLTLWGPIDPSYYSAADIINKPIRFGFAGGAGNGERKEYVDYLKVKAGLVVPTRNESWGSYQEYANFLMSCQMVFNLPATGSGKAKHMKYRVIESGLAKCCLFEERGSEVTKKFFTPGFHFTSFGSKEELAELVNGMDKDFIQAFALAHHQAVREKCSPVKFWGQVLDALDIEDEYVELSEMECY